MSIKFNFSLSAVAVGVLLAMGSGGALAQASVQDISNVNIN